MPKVDTTSSANWVHNMHEYLIRWRGPEYIAKKGRQVEKSLLHGPIIWPMYRSCVFLTFVKQLAGRSVELDDVSLLLTAARARARAPPPDTSGVVFHLSLPILFFASSVSAL